MKAGYFLWTVMVFCANLNAVKKQFAFTLHTGQQTPVGVTHSGRSPGDSKTYFVGYCVEKDVTFPDSLVMMGKEWKGAFFGAS